MQVSRSRYLVDLDSASIETAPYSRYRFPNPFSSESQRAAPVLVLDPHPHLGVFSAVAISELSNEFVTRSA